ncbi:MAG: DUF4124 domain-containing protein [Burkholderiaceae bacterium]
MARLTLIKSWCVCAAIGAALYVPAAIAQGDGAVYRCKDANGTTMFTNNPGNAKSCEKMQIQSVSTIPAPKLPAARSSNGGSAATPTPPNFPRVDTAQQKARDEGRRDILEDELAKQETKCAALKKEFNNGEPERQGNERNFVKYQERVAKMKEDVARCDADIVALKKEIALIK